ncbi:hypothetical protein EMMF5_004076 [Cystobasidiomycetes sp. EMM_F5]
MPNTRSQRALAADQSPTSRATSTIPPMRPEATVKRESSPADQLRTSRAASTPPIKSEAPIKRESSPANQTRMSRATLIPSSLKSEALIKREASPANQTRTGRAASTRPPKLEAPVKGEDSSILLNNIPQFAGAPPAALKRESRSPSPEAENSVVVGRILSAKIRPSIAQGQPETVITLDNALIRAGVFKSRPAPADAHYSFVGQVYVIYQDPTRLPTLGSLEVVWSGDIAKQCKINEYFVHRASKPRTALMASTA